jgi:hypothetical protein
MKEVKLPEISWLYITERKVSIIDLLSETLCKVVAMINTMIMTKGNEKVITVVKQYKGKQRNSYKHTVMSSLHQNGGQNQNSLIRNKSFEAVNNFKYWGATFIYQNCIHEIIQSTLN